MKVVIISKNCTPLTEPRANRTTELAKELARQGHNVIVYALLGDYDYSEISAHTNISFKNLGNSKCGLVDNLGHSKKTLINRFIWHFTYKYTLYPEPEFLPMVKRAIKREGDIDLLITIAAPHMIHYAAARSNLTRVKNWIADCGDPFMGNPFDKHPSYFEKMERSWCEKCDYVTIPIEAARSAYYKEFQNKIKIIPQGFNFSDLQLEAYSKNACPTFTYTGIIYEDNRNPKLFMEYLCQLQKPFKFIVYTRSIRYFEAYKDRLGDKLEIRKYVPREELLRFLSSCDFLVNFTNDSSVQAPSKLIDYALTKRPILNVSSKFDTEEQKIYLQFLDSNYDDAFVFENLENYNIVNVVKSFLSLCKL